MIAAAKHAGDWRRRVAGTWREHDGHHAPDPTARRLARAVAVCDERGETAHADGREEAGYVWHSRARQCAEALASHLALPADAVCDMTGAAGQPAPTGETAADRMARLLANARVSRVDKLAYAEAVAGARYAEAIQAPPAAARAAADAYGDALARVRSLAGRDHVADLVSRLVRVMPDTRGLTR